jgi:ribonuclease P protein component
MAVRQTGARIRVQFLDVRSAPSSGGHPRVGVIVPRYNHSAVDRNRLKRRIRELTRTHLLPVLPSVDLIIRALPSAYDASFPTLAAQIDRVAGIVCAAS